MAAKTPQAKRLNTDMEFSPEANLPLDRQSLRDLLGEVLEEKLESFLHPLKEDIKDLKGTLEKQKTDLEREILSLKKENKILSERTAALECHLERTESFQRKNNLRIDGIKEGHGENLDSFFVSTCNKYIVNGQLSFNHRTLERIHRLGLYKQGSTRTVVARFAHYKDKMAVLQIRNSLKDKHGIYISDDLPHSIEAKRKELYPVYMAIKNQQRQQPAGPIKSVKLTNDKLWVNGVSYTTDKLDSLPEMISLDKLFNPCNNGIVAFFRKHSKLSNHHQCSFIVHGERFSSMEKFLMSTKADFFGDHELVHKISMEDDPVTIKKLGSRVKNFNSHTWQNEIGHVLHEGLMAKFSQNSDLSTFLIATCDTTLAEANQHDSTYGIGLSLKHKDLWDKQKWPRKNLLGNALMKVRQALKE